MKLDYQSVPVQAQQQEPEGDLLLPLPLALAASTDVGSLDVPRTEFRNKKLKKL